LAKTATVAGGCKWLKIDGGAEGDRTPDLRIANAALCQTELLPHASKNTVSSFEFQASDPILLRRTIDATSQISDNSSIARRIKEIYLPRPDCRRLLWENLAMRAKRLVVADKRTLALKMRPDSITAAERGRALRITTLLETEQNAASDSVDWAPAWVNVEDRP
jgi:hypothetical protein